MPDICCHACGIRARSAGDNPPPSWLRHASGLVLCEDCRVGVARVEAGYRAAGITADAATVLAEVRQLSTTKARMQTRPLTNLSDRREP